MARERGQAEPECGKSIRAWGWFGRKKTDALVCQNCKRIVIPSGPAGTWDFPEVYVPLWKQNCALYIDIEVKAGGSRLDFARFDDDQRQWALDHPERPKWLWIGLGRGAVTSKREPRRTYFMTLEAFLEMERELSTKRNSVPYACLILDKWELVWVKSGVWSVPLMHPARTVYEYF